MKMDMDMKLLKKLNHRAENLKEHEGAHEKPCCICSNCADEKLYCKEHAKIAVGLSK
jgi:hypothetical protein